MSKKHKFGFLPDLVDQRDFTYASLKARPDVPRKVDLRPYDSKVEDQGDIGSCVGHALASLFEHQDNKKDGKFSEMSRLFVYYNARAIDDSVKSDCGTHIRSAIKAICNQGICLEKKWPYIESKVCRKPSKTAYKAAKKYGILEYRRVKSFNAMFHCLADGNPFAFGIPVYESFYAATKNKGKVPNPRDNEAPLGGHAMLCVGYIRKAKRFIVKNSWGPKWGRSGYCLIPFKYMKNCASDCWSIIQVEGA